MRIVTSKDILVADLHFDKKAIRSLAKKNIITADVTFSEYSPIAHESAGGKYSYRTHCRLEQFNAFDISHRYLTAFAQATHEVVFWIE